MRGRCRLGVRAHGQVGPRLGGLPATSAPRAPGSPRDLAMASSQGPFAVSGSRCSGREAPVGRGCTPGALGRGSVRPQPALWRSPPPPCLPSALASLVPPLVTRCPRPPRWDPGQAPPPPCPSGSALATSGAGPGVLLQCSSPGVAAAAADTSVRGPRRLPAAPPAALCWQGSRCGQGPCGQSRISSSDLPPSQQGPRGGPARSPGCAPV